VTPRRHVATLEAREESAIGEYAFVYHFGRITIGWHATISHCARLCAGAFDRTKSDFALSRPPIAFGTAAYICADAFVGPGVTGGEGATVGAGAVVLKGVKPWMIVIENTARD
jgi:putative colanic acid biosynthesis acetyltransferase WcaF